jgi:hypothetical protein
MSTTIDIKDINKARAQNGQPPLNINGPEETKTDSKVVKEIHHHHYTPEDTTKIISGGINRIALARYLFPLCAGSFTGAIVNQVYGIIWSMALSLLFVAVVGFLLAYDDKKVK